MSYQGGPYLPATWRPDSGSAVTCKILKSEHSQEGTELVKKLAGNSALPEVYAGFSAASFSMNLLFDGSAMASNIGFRFGQKGTLSWAVTHSGTTPDKWIIAHVFVKKVNYVNNVDDLLEYGVDFSLDASSNAFGQSAPFVHPV